MFGVILKTTLKSWTVWAGTTTAQHTFNQIKIEKLNAKQNRVMHECVVETRSDTTKFSSCDDLISNACDVCAYSSLIDVFS